MVVWVIWGMGLGLGKIDIWGIWVGVRFVLFGGIVGGDLGVWIEGEMVKYGESLGVIIFVYGVGVEVGGGEEGVEGVMRKRGVWVGEGKEWKMVEGRSVNGWKG